MSLIAIVILTAGYELVRDMSRKYEASHSAELQAYSNSAFSTSNPPNHPRHDAETRQGQSRGVSESSSLLRTGNEARTSVERKGTVIKAALYAVQVFYSFFIMSVDTIGSRECTADMARLLFMTYNGWVMLAVAVGAFVGYLLFSANLSSTKSVACH